MSPSGLHGGVSDERYGVNGTKENKTVRGGDIVRQEKFRCTFPVLNTLLGCLASDGKVGGWQGSKL